jgi:hypothetical protein
MTNRCENSSWPVVEFTSTLGDIPYRAHRHESAPGPGPRLVSIFNTVTQHVGSLNDVVSFRCEHFQGHDRVDLIRVGDFAEAPRAVDAAMVDILEMEDRYHLHRARLLSSDPDAVLREWVRILDGLIVGSVWWSFSARRYHGPGWKWDGRFTARWRLEPHRTVAV